MTVQRASTSTLAEPAPSAWARRFWKRPPPPLLGIDVSTSSMRLVELDRDKAGTLVLERCASEPLERGWVVDGQVEQFEEAAQALRRLVRQSGSPARHAALALPASAVFTQKVTLPGNLPEQALQALVESEASQYLPFPLEEVSLDFCVTGPAPGAGAAPEVEVLIAASRKDKVQDRQGLAEAAGLTPVVVDVAPYAARLAVGRLAAALPDANALVALFQVGAQSTGMQVLRGNELVYERDQAIGGAQLTQAITRQYGLLPPEAEARKRTGDLPPDYAPAVLAPFVNELALEISQALRFFFTSTPHHQVSRLLLAGGSAALPGLAEAVARHSSFTCELVNPFDGMRPSETAHAPEMAREASAYLTACGLALRRFCP